MAPVLKTGIPERVSGVRIPPSPPDSRNSIQHRSLQAFGPFRISTSPECLLRASGCIVVAHIVSSAFIVTVASLLTVFYVDVNRYSNVRMKQDLLNDSLSDMPRR
jgi:hypothetical protein